MEIVTSSAKERNERRSWPEMVCSCSCCGSYSDVREARESADGARLRLSSVMGSAVRSSVVNRDRPRVERIERADE